MENDYDNIDEELEIINCLNKSLDHYQVVLSSGKENSLQHLLTIPELAEIDAPDEETIEYVESLVRDTEEQRLLSENDDEDVTAVGNPTDPFSDPHDMRSIPTTDISQDLSSNIESIIQDNDESEVSNSPTKPTSRFSFFSSIFSSRNVTSSSSSASSKTSYISRLFNRKKNETPSPQSHLSIPSCNSQNDDLASTDLDTAEELIADTEAQGPTGTPHLSCLAQAIQRPILAFSSSMTLHHHAGRDLDGPPVMVQFHSMRPGTSTGHWTLLGNRDPEGLPMTLNNCLFNVIFAQTGKKPSDLRQATIEEMRRHIKSLALRIKALLRQYQCEGLVIMIGGARYTGKSACDAKKVIDNSQAGKCHPGGQQGHPRGHASYSKASEQTASVENYSIAGEKSAFLSRCDQDRVGHLVLRTEKAQQAMNDLNRRIVQTKAVHVFADDLPEDLPLGATFRDGVGENPRPIRKLIIVLRHHAGEADNPDYPVFVHTFFPVLT